MEHALVVVDGTDAHRDLLREAAENASGTDANLLLLMLLDESEYEHDLDTLESIGDVENVSYGEGTILEGAEQDARDIAHEVVDGDFDLEWDVLVDVVEEDERARAVVQAGADNDCDHAFIVGQNRSPTGKAIFGDFAQRVILNFDGYVTVATE
ncbi:universal stress protein (plasmid) [Halarchaeum sp. CBA1220]|uniref:universal stress protein n=1 Tax=Halarchaeum sp. CBA1220 TaxID=1853682 RepID=UPI000F3AA98A|nr:universal stress protein [Halarchaeum sp. CBA1220]QLC34785.1 universal stress protein [Halarchaeum sp. CBA1220]